jgi:hypothetical protein
MEELKSPPAPNLMNLLLSDALRAYEMLAPIQSPASIGAGRRTIYSLHNRIAKSHAGKPPSYVKPHGVRSKGYAEHGNGKRRTA